MTANRSPTKSNSHANASNSLIALLVGVGGVVASAVVVFRPWALVAAAGLFVAIRLRHLSVRRKRSIVNGMSPSGLTSADRMALWCVRLFPLAFGIAVQARRLALGALVVIAIAAFASALGRPPTSRVVPPLLAALLATSAVAWAIQPETRWVVVVLISFIGVATGLSRVEESSRATAILAVHDAVGIYMVASVFLYYGLGLRSPGDAGRYSQAFSAAKFFGIRATFPLTSAITTPPALAAAFLVGLFALHSGVQSARGRTFRLTASLCAIVVLLASNGRTATAAVLLLIIAIRFAPSSLRRIAPLLCTAMICTPLYLQTLNATATRLVSSYVPFFNRGTWSQGAANFGGRSQIWKVSIHGFGDVPPVRKLFGFGAHGQVTSGVSFEYSRYLRGFLRFPQLAHPHSTILQVLFDSGLVGAVLFVAAIAVSLIRLGQTLDDHQHKALCAIAMISTLSATAATDSLLAPGHNQETFWVLALMFVAAVGLSTPNSLQRRCEHDDLPSMASIT